MDETMKALAEVLGTALAEMWLREQAKTSKAPSAASRHNRHVPHPKSGPGVSRRKKVTQTTTGRLE